MLPIPVLDDERFGEIAENARRMIPRIYPQWTDFNFHDPGITFLELFAFLKESQQYHLDQIGPRNRQKYLKLLGVEQEHRSGARVWVTLSGLDRDAALPRGTRLWAGEIPFETERTASLTGSRLRRGFCWDEGEGRKVPFASDAYAEAGKMHLPVFGREALPGSALYLCFDGPLPQGRPVGLYLGVSQDYAVARNPVEGGDFEPLAHLCWEYLSPEGWQALEVLEDGTRDFLFSGAVTLRPGGAMCAPEEAPAPDAAPLEGEPEGYWLRARLVRSSYDVPPVLSGLSDEMIPAVQRETLAECARLPVTPEGSCLADGALPAAGAYEIYTKDADGFWRLLPGAVRRDGLSGGAAAFTLPEPGAEEALLLCWREEFAAARHLGEGDGFPHQVFELGRGGQLPGAFRLLVAEPDRPGAWSLWEQTADFDASGAEDNHFVLDEEAGVVRFGDCEHGRAPEGEILVAASAVSLGAEGNVKAGRIRRISRGDLALALGDPEAAQRVSVNNHADAAGGRAREAEEDCFLRCRRLLRQTSRAVTYADYEQLVRQTPGLMISNCRTLSVKRLPRQDGSLEENCVTVVAEPFSLKQIRRLSPAYEINIRRQLEARRMLGTKVAVLSPEYVGITVYAEIQSQPHYVDARSRIQAAVEGFFSGGWSFGESVRYSALYGIIDTLDCVAEVDALTIDAQGKGITRGINGDVILPLNGLAYLKSASFQVRAAEE